MTQQGPDSSQDFTLYSNATPNTLVSHAVQSSNDDYQLGPFHSLASSSIPEFQMQFYEGLPEAEGDNGNSGLKLGYRRASVACKQCRHRKIRCIASSSDTRGRCTNCVRLQKDCGSYLTSQSSADSAAPNRVARSSTHPDESLSVTGLSNLCFNTLQDPEGSYQPLSPAEMWAGIYGAPVNTGVSRTVGFPTASVTNGQLSLNIPSHTLPEWQGASLSPELFTNAQELDPSQEVPFLEDYSSRSSTLDPISRASTSSILPYQGDTSVIWNSDSYSMSALPLGGFSESANIRNTLIGTDEADFGVYTSVSTNQLFPSAVNYTAQDGIQSLPYAERTSDRYME
ncbi:hypothetical protein F52700_3332 [Fusarium sp. NRRL 52700]|nr:hypothetical protein F52700_3332 [Fusarium sp. NRRL 52700]